MRKEQEVFDELAALCQSKGYAHVVAYFSARDNLVIYKDQLKGSDYAKLFSWNRLIRTEISTLIGLMARGPIDLGVPSKVVLEELASRTEALLQELHEAMMEPFGPILSAAMADPSKPNPFAAAEALREPIFYGSESAYTFQYRDIAPKKYSRDNEWLTQNKGFSIEHAQAVVLGLMKFLSKKGPEVFSGLKDLPPDSWTVLPVFEFSAEDIGASANVEAALATKIIDSFSFSGGGNPTFMALHEFNATNAYPIMKCDNGRYVCFQYMSLTEALYDTPFYWMVADKEYYDEAMTNRGIFTEEFSADRLEKVFGAANVYRNVDVWKTKGEKLAEIDVLVLYANRAIVVQAKSKKLTLAARKGNDLQLQADFKAAVQDACDQAIVCGNSLISSLVEFTNSSGDRIEIPKAVRKIHPLCVVSDHYPALTFQAQQFLKVVTTDIIEKPIVCDVFWLDVVSEMLDSPLRFLSYLELRAMAGDNVLISHENVALGYHLKQNLWLGEHDVILLHDDLSADLDVAMAVRREGIPGERTPSGILTLLSKTRVGKIINEIERRSEPALIGLGLELLKLDGKAAHDISVGIDKIAKVTAKDGRQHDLTVGIGRGKTGLTIHCNNLADAEAFGKLQRHCELRKYSQKAPTWHGFAVHSEDAALRFGLMLDFAWKEDASLAKDLEKMPEPFPASKLSEMIGKISPRMKIGRNESCACGSGKKYKKCCLLKPKH